MRWLLLLTGVAIGQPAASEDFSAVGRILSASGKVDAALCTGTLVAPRLVLTAAHCLAGWQASPKGLVFQAGYQEGQMVGSSVGQAILLANAYAPGKWRTDAGLLVLEDPIEHSPISAGGLIGDQPSLHLYSRSAPEIPTTKKDCSLFAKDDGLYLLNCSVVSGNSGGPVLEHDGTGWRVVAIVVARSASGAIANRIPAEILEVISTALSLQSTAPSP